MVKFNLLALGSLVASALAATLEGDRRSISVSSTRITTVAGAFASREQVTGEDLGRGGMVIADDDALFLDEIRGMWRTAQGSSSGIYEELQQVALVIYDGQTVPWNGPRYALWLPPFSRG